MMEELWNKWSNLVQNEQLSQAFAKFAWIDWVAFVFVILGILYGFRKGLMRMMVEVLEIIVVILLLMNLSPKVSYYLTQSIDKLTDKVADPIAYIVTFAIVWVLVSIIDGYLKKLIKTELFFPIKILGGGLFGILSSLLVLGIFVQIIAFIPTKVTQRVFESGRSMTGSALIEIAPGTYRLFTNPAKFVEDTMSSKGNVPTSKA